jgi:organic radical activating enzyme
MSIEKYNYLDYLEISICDFCNLNCKGCSHFSNLVKNRECPEFSDFQRDFTQLKKSISHISKIRIMGGEPFLNKDLPKYIKMIKNIYPFSDLRVCTNGLLLLDQDESMLEVLRENNVILDISVYPPMFDNILSVLGKLDEFEIEYYYEIIAKFKPILLDEEKEYYYKELINCSCINLKNGHLAPCPVIFYINHYNMLFNKNYPEDGGKIDIYNTKLEGRQIIDELKKPFELCNYCAHHREDLPFFNWEATQGNFNKNDWLSKEDKWQ